MKKFFNSTINLIVYMFIVLSILFLILMTFTYVFSIKSNMTLKDTISYFKEVTGEVLNINQYIIINTPNANNNANIDNTPTNNKAPVTYNLSYYYFSQLDDNAKIIYNALENNINNFKKGYYVIDFSTTFNDLLHTSSGRYQLNKSFQSALDAFFYDHPELFYINSKKITMNTVNVSIGGFSTYSVEIKPTDASGYYHDTFKNEQDVNEAIMKVEQAKREIINSVKNKDTYYKIKAIHDTLINSIEYDLEAQNCYTIYGALINKKVVCEGYAKAFKYILDDLDIECILVSGDASSSPNETEKHMWNYVQINNQWYGIDLTWDDPIINGNSNNLRYNYLLKGYYTFKDTHIPTGKISDTGMRFIVPSLSYDNYR